MPKRISEQIGPFSAVKPKTHFFEVGSEMLCAEVMPRSHDSALEKRERVLDGIGVNISDHINFLAMVDCLVLVLVDSSPNHRFGIANPVIGDDLVQIDTHAVFEVLGECFGLRILDMIEPEIATTLPDADYDFFLGSMRSASTLFDAADIGFVHFDCAIEHWFIDLCHCSADAMAEIPSRFVADSERALNLACRHAFLRFTQQQSRHKPLSQRQVGIVEDRPGCDGELIAALAARELLARSRKRGMLCARLAFRWNAGRGFVSRFEGMGTLL